MNISNIFVLEKTLEKLLTEKINNVLLDEFQNIVDIVLHSPEEQHLVEELRSLTLDFITLYKKKLPEILKLVKKINEQKTIEQEHLNKKLTETLKLFKKINEKNFSNEMYNQELGILSLDQTNNQLDLLIKKIETSQKIINNFYNDKKKEISFLLEETKIIKERVHFFHEKVKDEFNQKKDLMISRPNLLGATNSVEQDQNLRKIVTDNKLEEQLGSKIRQYTDWKYPTLEIGPGQGRWTDNLVGSDPLYLLEIHEEYLELVKKKYPQRFSERIQTCLIGAENHKSFFDFSELPNNQMGFIFSWGVFDFYDYNEVDFLLESCKSVLRPGGVLFFSYNDCDYLEGIKLAEKNLKTWLTKDLLKNLFTKHKLILLEFETNLEKNTFWVSVKKEGEKKSIKISQPFITIETRNGYERFDNSGSIKYNRQQIARIKQLAIQLGIDNETAIMADQYDPHKLMKLIEIARMKK